MKQLSLLTLLVSTLGIALIVAASLFFDAKAITPSDLAVEVRQPIVVSGTANAVAYRSGWVEGELIGECSFPFSMYVGNKQSESEKVAQASVFKGELIESANKVELRVESYW